MAWAGLYHVTSTCSLWMNSNSVSIEKRTPHPQLSATIHEWKVDNVLVYTKALIWIFRLQMWQYFITQVLCVCVLYFILMCYLWIKTFKCITELQIYWEQKLFQTFTYSLYHKFKKLFKSDQIYIKFKWN